MPARYERLFKRSLIAIALASLGLGLAAWGMGHPAAARLFWSAGIVPVAAGLLLAMIRDLVAGKMGVDAIAFLSMTAAVLLGEPLAGIVVAVMYAGGTALEDFALARAERDLKSLIDRTPRIAHRIEDHSVEDVGVEDVEVGDRILVRGGEIIPVDGMVGAETATIDESALSGEPIPVERSAGEAVRSGTLNAGETFEMRATATAGESTYAGIIRMVSAAQAEKSPFIRLADRFALVLLPVTLTIAAAAWVYSGDPVRALAVMVAATPCPLILAAPVAFIAGVARATRKGILIKGGAPIEALARAHTVMFDKTGTLTVGGARLVAIEVAPGQDPDAVLQAAASLEQASQHVVAEAIVKAAVARGMALDIPTKVREAMGSGLEGDVRGRIVRVGAHQLVCGSRRPRDWEVRALRRAAWRSALSVFVAVDGNLVGALLLGDELRRETPRAVRALRAAGIARIVMVTGDRADAAETIGAALDLDAVLADRVPADKVDAVAFEQRLKPTVMVGDGINDAPALAAADVGVAMGARGASASSEAADVVILVDRLDRVSDAVSIARRTRAIALQSIVAGMGLSAIAMGFAAAGFLPPVAGALTQEVIDVAVILNALRALGSGKPAERKALPEASADALRDDHQRIAGQLDRLRAVADLLDDASAQEAVALILEAREIVARDIVEHEKGDEQSVYPLLARYLTDAHALERLPFRWFRLKNGKSARMQGPEPIAGAKAERDLAGYALSALSRAHREIIHLSRLLDRIAEGLAPEDADRYLVRDAQRIIETIEALARLHNAQEEDIYDYAMA